MSVLADQESAEHESAEHAVLLAQSEEELVGFAARRIVDALDAGAAMMLIVTPERHAAFLERIRAAGHDPGRAVLDGVLRTFDAVDTLARLSSAGAVDGRAVSEEMGAELRAMAAGRPVLVFGEMVALLWEQGRVEEALELETVWDRLVRETGGTVLCAYPGTLIDDHRRSADLREVCDLHSSVVAEEPLERTWHLPPQPASVREGRRLVANALRARGISGQRLEDSLVVAAELMANALVHGRSAFSVRVHVDGARVLLEVEDASSRLPLVRPLEADRPSGRGLHLLAALADRWGVEELASGKRVWAELAR